MNLNDSFEDLIEYDPGSCSDKENEVTEVTIKTDTEKQPKPTSEQFRKMSSFAKEHNVEEIDKTTYDMLWNDLAAKLNDVGPPAHTTSAWRRIWSLQKYNNKRKRLTEPDFQVQPVKPITVLSGEPVACTSVDQRSVEISNKLDVVISNQTDMSVKIDTIIKNQDKMITNHQNMIRELQISNRLLQEIAIKPF
ncbi:uncharacterized protein LOC119078684 [Bradysia coprophila]|uniref:uncharacterized protein LOC119078684 n=1 Tax=Bradysia coprophila TaxID=38358 RepID=UPI00187D90D1|nr:uncharacterized protein LOC119078684 [Bradysia coprophila]